MNTPATACWHCGAALPADPPVAQVAGSPRPVCCHGCRAAAQWIEGLGLADYYRLRDTPAERPVEHSTAQVWARPELARHAVRILADGRSEVLPADLRAVYIDRAGGGEVAQKQAFLALPGIDHHPAQRDQRLVDAPVDL